MSAARSGRMSAKAARSKIRSFRTSIAHRCLFPQEIARSPDLNARENLDFFARLQGLAGNANIVSNEYSTPLASPTVPTIGLLTTPVGGSGVATLLPANTDDPENIS